ncbi:hypothetical protein CASFOL_001495 [Castilleja foliolosa]|uniref:Uncharacterized protein n=1 Tax=Castilleja foliolosa TaxID=1961234 RepID=A0ABD3EJC3_9LAMI
MVESLEGRRMMDFKKSLPTFREKKRLLQAIARNQIEDCRTRYNGDADHHQRRKKFSFPRWLSVHEH